MFLRRPASILNLATFGLGLGACAVVALAVTSTSTDKLLVSGFDRALATVADTPAPAGAIAPRKAFDGVAGSEDFWLRAAAEGKATGVTRAVSVGDRITIAKNGVERRLAVVDIRDVTGGITHIDMGGPSSQLLLVTCRDADAGPSGDIRFLMETNGSPLAAPIIKAARAL